MKRLALFGVVLAAMTVPAMAVMTVELHGFKPSYTEIKGDLAGIVRRVAEFTGVRLSDEQTAQVLGRCSFDYMKRNQSRFDPIQTVPWAVREGSMVRSGRRGGSAELLSKAQRRQIDTHFRTELQRLHCDFPYDEVFDTD